jgi:hypothetical protein
MKQSKKREYTTPTIERLEARVELGYVVSGEETHRDIKGTGMESYGKGTGNESGGYVFS